MNAGDLKDAVAAYLNRDNMQDAHFAAMVGSAHSKIQRALKEHTRNRVRAAYEQAAGDAFLPLPTDLIQIIGLYKDGVQLNQYPSNSREIADFFGNCFIQQGTCLELFPTPEAVTEYRLDYYAMLGSIDTANEFSTNWVLTYYPDIYIYAVLSEAAIFYRDDSRYQPWTAEFVQRVSELNDQGWGQNLTTLPQVSVS